MNNGANNPRGAQASPGNKLRYDEEIAKMEGLGERFTLNQYGKVNVGAFAARCGFSRYVIEKGALADKFAKDIVRIGVATANDFPRFCKKAEDKQKMASDLQKTVNLRNAEVEMLREKVEELTKQVRELQLGHVERNRTLEHLLATGERFLL